jgi:hypothetical protein
MKMSTKVLLGFLAATLLAICVALIRVATIAAPILASGAV